MLVSSSITQSGLSTWCQRLGFGAGEDHEEQDALKKTTLTTLPKEGDIAEIYGLKKAAGF